MNNFNAGIPKSHGKREEKTEGFISARDEGRQDVNMLWNSTGTPLPQRDWSTDSLPEELLHITNRKYCILILINERKRCQALCLRIPSSLFGNTTVMLWVGFLFQREWRGREKPSALQQSADFIAEKLPLPGPHAGNTCQFFLSLGGNDRDGLYLGVRAYE